MAFAYDAAVADESTRDVDDLATARTLIATLQDELTRVQRENTSLRHQLDLLCQRLFGKKSERVSPDQLRLAFAQLGQDPPAAADEPIEMDSGERPGPGRRRRVPPRRRAGDRSPRRCPATASRSTWPRPTRRVRAAS